MPADAATLSVIAREAKALWGYDPDWLELWHSQLTLGPSDVERMIVRVAELNAVIVGFGAVDRTPIEWELSHLWVRPAYSRRGIGQELLKALMTSARHAGATRLRIESDPHAEAFYLSAGAMRIGSVPAPMPGAPGRVLPVLELELG